MARIFESDILLLLLLGCCIGSFGSSVQLYPFTKETHSDCSSDFVHGLDRYIYRATLNTTNQDLGYRSVVNFEVKSSSSSGFNLACQVSVNPLSNCDVTQPSECYCRNTPNSIVEVFLNKTADIRYSNGTLRIYWPNFPYPDEKSEKPIPIVYPDVVQSLKVNNKTVNLDTCNSELNLENLIQYCVYGLSSHNLILNFSTFAPIQSPDECVNHTYISSHTVNESSIKFSVSFLEHDGCKRTQINECYLHNVSTTTATTLNTTFVSSSSTLKNNYETPSQNENISNVLTGVLSAHVVCTVAVIVTSIIVLAIIFKTVLRQQDHTRSRPLHLDLLCLIITLFEIAQIILVIIAGVQFFGEGGTALDIWKIMIIYQVLVNGIFVLIESIILGIKTNSNGFQGGSQTFLYLITLICIHTVIGIIAVPFLWHFLGSAGLSTESNYPVHGNNDSIHHSNPNEQKKKPQADAIINNQINANVSVQENTQQESDQSGPKKVKKKTKLGRIEHLEKEAETKENNTELELKDLSIPIKRPTSIEETKNPSLVNPRKLPPLNKK